MSRMFTPTRDRRAGKELKIVALQYTGEKPFEVSLILISEKRI